MSVDPLAEQYPAWSPFNYVLGNPISLIDPLGLLPESPDWEWRINSKTGEYKKIGNKGGATTQYIYWNDDKSHSDVLQGSEIHVGPVAKNWYSDGDFEYAVHTVDLWADIPEEYQGAYTKFDLADRYNAMQKGDPNDIAGQEAMGLPRREQIWNSSDYGRYLDQKYGSRSGFIMMYDNGLQYYMLPSGALYKVMAAQNASAKFGSRFGKLFAPAFGPVQSFSKNPWIRYLQMTKGQYKGQGANWINQASSDYHKLKAVGKLP